MKKNIHISGSGVAGLTSALKLAQNGFKVIVHEKGHFVGGRDGSTIHGILNYGSYDKDVIKQFEERLNISLARAVRPINIMKRVSPSNYFYYTKLENNQPVGYNIMRGNNNNSIENILVDECVKFGVEIEIGSSYDQGDSHIIATGSKYPLFMGYGIFAEIQSKIDNEEIQIILNDEFAPKGYSYILPFDNYATIAIFALKNELKESMQKYFNKFIESLPKYGIRLKYSILNYDAGIGSAKIFDKYYANGKYFVGAAGNLLTLDYGFGLKNAVESGILASESIIKNDIKVYSLGIRSKIEPELVRSFYKRLLINRGVDYDRKFKEKNGIIELKYQKKYRTNILTKYLAYILNKIIYEKY